ncbi:MAG: beta-hydroxyacyl-ACP dehydratase [Oligoflexia bacterium]|nr:beta-hydroxyacyl-ACP dehydratase [Oligoflexia bacterium]
MAYSSEGKVSGEILDLIPQRDPFLFVDTIVDRTESKIITGYQVTGKEGFFQGHFPGNPIMPGVLLQEATFQTGALLMGTIGLEGDDTQKVGVVTRVQDVKFKNFVKPGDLLEMEVELTESMANAFYFKGKTRVNGKVVMAISFTGALVDA